MSAIGVPEGADVGARPVCTIRARFAGIVEEVRMSREARSPVVVASLRRRGLADQKKVTPNMSPSIPFTRRPQDKPRASLMMPAASLIVFSFVFAS